MTGGGGLIDGVAVGVADGVGRIVIDRPGKLNTLTMAAQRRIIEAAAHMNRRDDLKVVVVSGAGGTFTAGVDVPEFVSVAGDEARILAAGRLGAEMCDAVVAIDAVTVASIAGHCVGGGILLAAACDLRVVAADTYLAIPEMTIGVPFTWGGVPRLMRELGPALTRELVMTGRRFSAAEAQAAGFVNRVVDAGDLDDEVAALVSDLQAKSRSSLLATKRSMREATAALIPTGVVGDDARLLAAAFEDEESAAMMRAYLERFEKRTS